MRTFNLTGIMAFALLTATGFGSPDRPILEIKREQMQTAARHAVDQQRVEALPSVPLSALLKGVGKVEVVQLSNRDGGTYQVRLEDIPANNDPVNIPDRLAVRFEEPMNFRSMGTGMAFWIKTPDDLSPDLRIGIHFKFEKGEDAIILADTPLRHRFGDHPHQIYMDWGYAFDHTVRPLVGPEARLFEKVVGFDITFVQKRLPHEPGVTLEPVSGHFELSRLELVDFYQGSYDSARFPKEGPLNANSPLVSQGRTQQVAHVTAAFGGERGIQSTLLAMDMMARIQCWDGSWPEIRTRLQGEFTHGMILKDLSHALRLLREAGRPELDEVVTIRHWTKKRDALYEEMLYRAAMSRSPGPLSSYADTYVSGIGAWSSGANRPMIYIVSQWVAAQVMTDMARRAELLEQYEINMEDMMAQQGAFSGGWPIFGEGNRFGGRGIRWDVGYTSDHVFIMALGSRVTGDPRWGRVMRRFEPILEAMILPGGYLIDGALSERGQAASAGLKAPDMVFQEALRHGATLLAQWGANGSRYLWDNWPYGLWAHASTARGYNLGAFLTWLPFDREADPVPRDLNHVFPREWSLWTARWFDKEGREVRRSSLTVHPDGRLENDFRWEIGEYPEVTGLPLSLEVSKGVTIQGMDYEGNVLAAGSGMAVIEVGTDPGALQPMHGDEAAFAIDGPTLVTIRDSDDRFTVAFRLDPLEADQKVAVRVRLLRERPSVD